MREPLQAREVLRAWWVPETAKGVMVEAAGILSLKNASPSRLQLHVNVRAS